MATLITTSSIANSAITSAKIADEAVTTHKIANNSITSVKIIDSSIAGSKLSANAVSDNLQGITSSVTLPQGNTSQRSSPVSNGSIRFNTETEQLEIGANSSFETLFRTDGGAFSTNIAGDLIPDVNATRNLGSSSFRWNNLYISDLNLTNGIGNYTIVEGEEDLYLYNNKNGKTYKFVLQEVDKSTVPEKRHDNIHR